MTDFTITDDEGYSKEQSLNPVHLVTDNEGNLPPSALVPFCSYQGDKRMLGHERPELSNLTMCNKFEPIILDGQLCYSLNVAKTVSKSTKAGKINGLLLLVDPYPYGQNARDMPDVEEQDDKQFKIFFPTLSQDTVYGPGTYILSALKRMTGTKNFLELPDKQKKCSLHNRETCQTNKLLDQIQRQCKCVPWALVADPHSNKKVIFICNFLPLSIFTFRFTLTVGQRQATALQIRL